MREYVVGLDIGTTSAKAVVFDLTGAIVATGRAAYEWDSGSNGIEIDPRRLAAAAHTALEEALALTPAGRVTGVGIASFAESGVLLDASGTPLAPVIAWHDRRDHEELARLSDEIGADEFMSTTGLPFRQQWSLTKHRWLDRNVPAIRRATVRLNVAEWIACTLGAERVAEQSLSSRTGWLDVGARDWWAESIDWSNLKRSMLPPLVIAGTRLGAVISGAVSSRLTGAAITVAGHDHQVAAVGLGATALGDEADSCGTAEALVRTVDPLPSEQVLALAKVGVTVGWHVLPSRWCLLAASEGGLLLGRTLAMLGIDDFRTGGLDDDAVRMERTRVRAQIDPTGALEFMGIDDTVSPASVWAAAIDLATEQATRLHESMSAVAGPHRSLAVTGGWAKSRTFLDRKRRSLGTFEVSNTVEAGARGAAVFAGVAAGLWSRADEHPLG